MASSSDAIRTLFLRDIGHGGDARQPAVVAGALAGFILAAQTSVDVAIYDFRLGDSAGQELVVAALVNAAARGVTVRIGYDAGKPAVATAEDFARLQADPAPIGTQEWIREHF